MGIHIVIKQIPNASRLAGEFLKCVPITNTFPLKDIRLIEISQIRKLLNKVTNKLCETYIFYYIKNIITQQEGIHIESGRLDFRDLLRY